MFASFKDVFSELKKHKELGVYWELMNKEELQELASSPVATIGSHGYYHHDFTNIELEQASRQLVQSKYYLENLIQKEIIDFAYPYGSYNDQLLKQTELTGYKRQLSLDYRSTTRVPSLSNRLTVNPYISWNTQLHYMLKGSYL